MFLYPRFHHTRLDIAHLQRIHDAAKIPLVLHGGSGIAIDDLRAAFRHGIAKINIGTDIRQPYERAVTQSVDAARAVVYKTVLEILARLGVDGKAAELATAGPA